MALPGQHIFQLPDHEYWNLQREKEDTVELDAIPSHSFPRSQSRSASTITFTGQGRKLSRKLPPTLTESLEDLSAQNPRTLLDGRNNSTASSGSAYSTASIAPENLFFLAVAPPAVESPTESHDSASTYLTVPLPVTPPRKRSFAEPAIASIDTVSAFLSAPTSAPRKRSIVRGSISGPTNFSHTASAPSAAPVTVVPAVPAPFAAIASAPAAAAPAMPFSSFSMASRSSASNDSFSSPACSSGSASTCGTWSVLDELEMQERATKRRSHRESRREKKGRKKAEEAAFDEKTAPSIKALFEASLLEVIDEDGNSLRFGDLVRSRKTVVIFIRHWFCPLCAQYMNSILAEVSPESLEEANVDLVIIGNGSQKMLDGYKNKAFKCPFKMYTDPSLRLYRALGLTRQTGDAGADEDKGEYLVQTAMEATVQTIKRATKMPLRAPGHFTQLGGEFVFDGTLNVIYTHRMTTTRSHAPIRDVVAEAGVRLEYIHYEPGPPPPPVHRASVIYEDDESAYDLDRWQEEREEQLDRIRMLKESRRGKKSLELKRNQNRGVVQIVNPDEEYEGVIPAMQGLGIRA
ncbi:hypothetical protein P7C73_g2911, partial [Tremellales sp. Uapishka_1]